MTRPTSMLNKVEQYLKFRRSLGYQLRVEGQQLQKFGAFVDAQGHHGPLTTELAVRWARLPVNVDRLYWARRLEIVRCFARYLVATEPGTELPPRGLLSALLLLLEQQFALVPVYHRWNSPSPAQVAPRAQL